MWELEAQASAMAWDWDADDIDPNDNDGKLWVPVTAQTLNMGGAEQYSGAPRPEPVMPPRHMAVYAVQPTQDGSAEQASVLVLMAVQTPQMTGCVVIKANQGEGESPRGGEMTAEEDGEREVSEPSDPSKALAMPRGKVMKVKAQRSPSKRARIPRQAKVMVLAEVRTVAC